MSRIKLRGFLTVLLLQMVGCRTHKVDPNPLPLVFEGEVETERSGGELNAPPWWTNFGIKELDHYIEEALSSNWDLRAAEERLRQSVSLSRMARARRFPQIGYDADGTISEGTKSDQSSELTAGVSGVWGLDMFGRLRSAEERDSLSARAQWWELRAVRLMISVHVAEAYLDVIAEEQLLQLLDEQEAGAQAYSEIVKVRYEQGLTTEIDVLQQNGQLAEIQSVVPTARSRLGLAEKRLGTLLGKLNKTVEVTELAFPGFLAGEERDTQGLELLINRPDLRQLQSEVASADADVGRALAERLPQFTLELDAEWDDITGYSDLIGEVTVGLVGPIIDFGLRKAESERTRAVLAQRMALYTQAYIGAVESVENARLERDNQRLLLGALDQRNQFLTRTLELYTLRYQRGLTDYLPVLNTQQNLYSLQQRLVREKRNYFAAEIELASALGGPVPPPEKIPLPGETADWLGIR